jgi:signal transduction histidine kinase
MRETAVTGEDLATLLGTIARERTTGMPIDVVVTTASTPRRLPRAQEDAAFRIGREAIVNAVRHAAPRRIEIRLQFKADALCLEVRDDGRGFTAVEAEEARQRGHFGLSGIQDRASHLGGRCDVQPRPGGGTIVALELPIPRG